METSKSSLGRSAVASKKIVDEMHHQVWVVCLQQVLKMDLHLHFADPRSTIPAPAAAANVAAFCSDTPRSRIPGGIALVPHLSRPTTAPRLPAPSLLAPLLPRLS
jgi:hypothetical protein